MINAEMTQRFRLLGSGHFINLNEHFDCDEGAREEASGDTGSLHGIAQRESLPAAVWNRLGMDVMLRNRHTSGPSNDQPIKRMVL